MLLLRCGHEFGKVMEKVYLSFLILISQTERILG